MSIRRLFPVILLLATSQVAHVSAAVDYFPLFMGEYATYQGFDPGSGYYYISGGISYTEVINGTTTYICAYPQGDSPDQGYLALAKVDGALMIFEAYSPESGTVTLDPPIMFLPANPTVGAEWTYTEPDGDFKTATVLAIESVTTLAGTFHNCIKVKRQGATNYQIHWYAPGIGEVKFYDEGGTVKEREEIVSFTTGPSCDTTPPTRPLVTDDGVDSYGNAAHGVWTSTDPESGIVEYKLTVSTTPDESGILMDWQTQAGLTETTSQGMGALLEQGTTYYALFKARNGAGLWSEIAVSGPITFRPDTLGESPWPLEVGNSWQYLEHGADSGDSVSFLRVTRPVVVGGQTRYVLCEENWYEGRWGELFRVAWADGRMTVYTLFGEDIDPIRFLDPPLTVGKSWSWPDPDGEGTTYFEVIADNETVAAPAGTFTGCARVRMTWSDNPGCDDFWFRPGVGLVQLNSYEEIGGSPAQTRVLTDWHVNPGPTDITPPTTPLVYDDGADSYGNILRARWTSSDPESAIADYMVAVSTTPDESGVLTDAPWRSTCGSVAWTSPSLPGLADGASYYVLVKARNSAGLWSNIGVSDGIIVHRALGESPWPLSPGNRWQYRIDSANTGERVACLSILSAVPVAGHVGFVWE